MAFKDGTEFEQGVYLRKRPPDQLVRRDRRRLDCNPAWAGLGALVRVGAACEIVDQAPLNQVTGRDRATGVVEQRGHAAERDGEELIVLWPDSIVGRTDRLAASDACGKKGACTQPSKQWGFIEHGNGWKKGKGMLHQNGPAK